MAIVLYKEGNTHNIRGIQCTAQKFSENTNVKMMEESGWVRDPIMLTLPTEEPELQEEEKEELSEDDIRLMASEAGIEKWDTKRIKTLRKELGLAE